MTAKAEINERSDIWTKPAEVADDPDEEFKADCTDDNDPNFLCYVRIELPESE